MIRRSVVQLARRVISQPVFQSAALGVLRAFSQPVNTVFMLHRFVDPRGQTALADGAVLTAVLATLRRQRVEFLSLAELVDRIHERRPSQRPSVTFTVDDGYRDFGSVGASIFRQFDCPVTVFLSTDIVSAREWYWWDRVEYAVLRSPRSELSIRVSEREHRFLIGGGKTRLQIVEDILDIVKFAPDAERRHLTASIGTIADVDIPAHPPNEYATLNWDEVRELERQGVRFGPHSCSHPIFSRIDETTARREIVDSWAAMKRECKNPEPIFCYPNGTRASFSDRDTFLVEQAGLRGAVAYTRNHISTRNSAHRAAFRIPRYELPSDSFDAAWIAAAVRARP